MTSTNDVSRRRMMQGAAVALAAGATGVAGTTLADTQTPVRPKEGRANPNGRFAGKSVLITGATSGIGRATASAFALEGARVAFCGRRANLGAEVVDEINRRGGHALYVQADVNEEAQVERFVAEAVRAHGRADILFANAGIDRPPAPTHETDTSLFDQVIATNLRAVFFTLKHGVAQMLRQPDPGGHIVNIASVGGHRGYPGITAYSAAKAAVLSMTRTAASEYSDKNIRVNSVSPGPIDTPMLRRAMRDWGLESMDGFAQGTTVKRVATPEEVARAVMWLCSPDASYVAGADLLVDGGYLLK